jgi:hypothetical protein
LSPAFRFRLGGIQILHLEFSWSDLAPLPGGWPLFLAVERKLSFGQMIFSAALDPSSANEEKI